MTAPLCPEVRRRSSRPRSRSRHGRPEHRRGVTAAPPVTATFLSLPSAKYAIQRPSGEKNGLLRVFRARRAGKPATTRAAARRAAASRLRFFAPRRRARCRPARGSPPSPSQDPPSQARRPLPARRSGAWASPAPGPAATAPRARARAPPPANAATAHGTARHQGGATRGVTAAAASSGTPRSAASSTTRASAMSCWRFRGLRSRQRRSSRRTEGGVAAGSSLQFRLAQSSTAASASETVSPSKSRLPSTSRTAPRRRTRCRHVCPRACRAPARATCRRPCRG